MPFPAESPIVFTTTPIWKGNAPVNNVGAEFGPLYSCVEDDSVPNPLGKTAFPHGRGPKQMKNPPPFAAVKNSVAVGVILTGVRCGV